MGKLYENMGNRLRAFIEEQPVFFTATAPLSGDGHVNVSPKGRSGSLVVLDGKSLAYLDFGGSNAETIAHLRENGRITLMWCAFTGPPKILRVHGRGEPVFRDDPRWAALIPRFSAADGPGARAIIVVTAERISDNCGYAVPFMDYRGERTLHAEYFGRKTDEEFAAYCERRAHVGTSLDGLPALPLPLPPRAMEPRVSAPPDGTGDDETSAVRPGATAVPGCSGGAYRPGIPGTKVSSPGDLVCPRANDDDEGGDTIRMAGRPAEDRGDDQTSRNYIRR